MRASEADARWERLLRKLGLACCEIQKWADPSWTGTIVLESVRFKLDADNRTSVLCVLKGQGRDGPVVGFVGGPDLETTILSLYARLQGDTIKWREDRPWKAE